MTYPSRTCPAGEAGAEASDPPVDLNMQLAREQAAIMRSEVATDVESRTVHRNMARDARRLIEETAFPLRAPHDFEVGPAVGGPARTAALDMTSRMARRLYDGFAGGFVSPKGFAHRSRVLRQAIARCG
ncbi:hypothetical protein [Rhizorhabdus sp. FW153]|uniref:hypothetical protein n=1 Tax=Rhizorhabdus sp. FW153 TaxID=3400216 RepID=UPI003CEEF93F